MNTATVREITRDLEVKLRVGDDGMCDVEIFEPESGDYASKRFKYPTSLDAYSDCVDKLGEWLGVEVCSWLSVAYEALNAQ